MFVDCVSCGNCCGYRRDSALGDWSFSQEEGVPEGVSVVEKDEVFMTPVDNDGTCIYLEVLNNGFTRCKIHDNKPKMCALYNCLTEKKIRYLQDVIHDLREGLI